MLKSYEIRSMLDCLDHIDARLFGIDGINKSLMPLTEGTRRHVQQVRDTLLRASLTDVAVEETKVAA